MNAGVWMPLAVALVVAVLSPYLIDRRREKARRAEKEQDWAREDAVAAKVQAAAGEIAQRAELLVASNAEVAGVLAEAAEKTDAKLDALEKTTNTIHALVNSDMTKALHAQLIALRSQLVLLNNVQPRTEEIHEQIADVRLQIGELEAVLEQRSKGAEEAAEER